MPLAARACRIPTEAEEDWMMAVKAIPGCETCNAAFFQQHGMALSAQSDEEAIAFAMELASDPERAERMRRAQRETLPLHAARTIAQFILNQ